MGDEVKFPIVGEFRQCPHGYQQPPWAHACDGCWCEGERDRREYGWPQDTTPKLLSKGAPNADH
jgi:hypothetical protein